MENSFSRMNREDEQIELPPGFRFHPTDEELITHYLSPKVVNSNFNAIAIGEADLNKSEPWDLPGRAKMGENEWYFFCVKDRKYPTGLRTNRATESGYWKATGKDKEIYRGKRLVGMKKTLVFYKGRAPKGEKSNWVMHEYRLDGKFPLSDHLPKTTKNEWVICRIFKKSTGDKRTHISELVRQNPSENELTSSPLPPLMDYSYSPYGSSDARAAHVTFFSNPPMAMDDTKPPADMIYSFKTHQYFSSSSHSSSNPSRILSQFQSQSQSQTPFIKPSVSAANDHHHLENPDSVWMPGNSIMRMLLENQTPNSLSLKQNPKMEFPHDHAAAAAGFDGIMVNDRMEDDEDYDPSTSDGQIDLESLWDY